MKLPVPRCPAAEILAGPPTKGPSAICRVLTRHAQVADSILEGEQSPLITARDEGPTLSGFCCGRGLPKVYAGQAPRAHYTYCPIWEAAEGVERERREAEERVFAQPDKPKILGIDPEVEAELLGIDVEQVPDRSAMQPETLVGQDAMEDVAKDDEWKEKS